ncbi:glycerol-3-phosphate dehydrogenase [Paracoccus fistulariae]|uniref:Glycerol-3-phosphate dehydrogenase n=1 Tax=Paracoccus fistulariae TaxID=658446 RepID=A0ABY7SGG2_9RHOB|nr:glycerol-3-phosphate dehydrogenase [Paracoccus fistulariae]MDB6182883.1 glycerol-3-phosphate dehydrogenase [Paracoccus fistulariae]WCR06110.1 glycerol-3-phosphate dehydrogenase [Paracoccus fistulariae]
MTEITDLFIIGGGVNGCGIARDAIGRGLSVRLAEMGDLAQATSSKSTKLFHGGLRYLEYLEIRLVREALKERETLLRAMPHISWPMRFVLPLDPQMTFESDTPVSRVVGMLMPWNKGHRPNFLIRAGLFMYDNLGGRKILPGTRSLSLQGTPEGAPLKDRLQKAYEYSDCWVEDARLVSLNARDAAKRGADILVGTAVESARRQDGLWVITLADGQVFKSRALVNAGGPWAGRIIQDVVHLDSRESVRLVRGSHIVTPKLYDHDKAYFFQGSDGRIIFAIPYETDFTLIGTTDSDFEGNPLDAECSPEEAAYLCRFASEYFASPVTPDQIVWSYSGVRPLYDDGASSATAATREYVLTLDENGPPCLNVFGGKITTYRKLSEHALEKLLPHFPQAGPNWTAGVPLPGGDFAVDQVGAQIDRLRTDYPFLDRGWATRLIRAYGTDARIMLGQAATAADLGRDFGATLTETEIRWLMDHEFARHAEDIVWRRSKLGLRLSADQIAAIEGWMAQTH